MMNLKRDQSVLGKWWWCVDRWTLLALALLMAIGVWLIQAASPAVAERIGLDTFHFVERHLLMLLPAILLLLGSSLLSLRGVRLLALLALVVSLAMVAATLVIGTEIKGATRWLHVAGFSLQPSEFLKPAFAVVAAWLLARSHEVIGFPGHALSAMIFGLCAMLLLLQPDFGMTFVLGCIWLAQIFLAGLPLIIVALLFVCAAGGSVAAYFIFPHVASRVNRFLQPETGDTFQVQRASEAFGQGGLFGTGPGEGTIKMSIPDVHADFIYAVAGEEFGLIGCLLLWALFVFIVVRGLLRLRREKNLFVVLAASGLFFQFGLQAFINMASTLHLIPTKGMTLPFISYGGSSLWAMALGMGMVLALTKKRNEHPLYNTGAA